MNWSAILTFAAELATWVLMAFGGSVILMVLWAAAGIGSHRMRERRRGVVGRGHNGSSIK